MATGDFTGIADVRVAMSDTRVRDGIWERRNYAGWAPWPSLRLRRGDPPVARPETPELAIVLGYIPVAAGMFVPSGKVQQ